jgi:hypothetical protein
LTPEPWYAPKDITWNRDTVLWLLRQLPTLKEGKWAKDPSKRDLPVGEYQAPEFKAGSKHQTPLDFAAELTRRLRDCRTDGVMVLLAYTYELDVSEIAWYFHKSTPQTERCIRACLWHICRRNYQEGRYRRRVLSKRAFRLPKGKNVATFDHISQDKPAT